jgi:hypothetical protein
MRSRAGVLAAFVALMGAFSLACSDECDRLSRTCSGCLNFGEGGPTFEEVNRCLALARTHDNNACRSERSYWDSICR